MSYYCEFDLDHDITLPFCIEHLHYMIAEIMLNSNDISDRIIITPRVSGGVNPNFRFESNDSSRCRRVYNIMCTTLERLAVKMNWDVSAWDLRNMVSCNTSEEE